MLESFQLYKTQRHDSLPIVTSCNWKRPYFARNDDAKMLPHPEVETFPRMCKLRVQICFQWEKTFSCLLDGELTIELPVHGKPYVSSRCMHKLWLSDVYLATQHKAMKHTVDGLIFVGTQFSQFS